MSERTSIKQARLNAKMKQKELADKLGLSVAAYAKKENGRSKFYVDEILLLSKILDIPYDDLNEYIRITDSLNAPGQKQNEKNNVRNIGHTVSVNHGGAVTIDGMTDDQVVNLHIVFDREIEVADTDAAVDELGIKINGMPVTAAQMGGYPHTYAVLSEGPDHKSVSLFIHPGFAIHAGHLTVTPPSRITQIAARGGSGRVQWTNISLYIPNGVKLRTLSRTAGNAETGTPAQVTKKVLVPSYAIRGMVHYLFLKNGAPVGPLDTYGGNFVAHFHDYLHLDSRSYAAIITCSFNSVAAFKHDYTMTQNGENITITAKSVTDGDVLDLRVYAYPYDQNTQEDENTSPVLAVPRSKPIVPRPTAGKKNRKRLHLPGDLSSIVG